MKNADVKEFVSFLLVLKWRGPKETANFGLQFSLWKRPIKLNEIEPVAKQKQIICQEEQQFCYLRTKPFLCIKYKGKLFSDAKWTGPLLAGLPQKFFTSLLRISALNLKTRHYVTLATPRAVPVRWAKVFIWSKVVPLARVTLPAEVRQLAHRGEFAFPM